MTSQTKKSASRTPKNGISTVVAQATGAPAPELLHFHIAAPVLEKLGAALVAYEKASSSLASVCDDLLAAGVTSEVVAGSDKGHTFCAEVLLSFESPEDRAVFASKPDTLEGREKKAEVGKRLKRRLGYVLRFLVAAEKLESLSVDQRGEKKKAELSQWIVDQINAIQKRVEKAEATSFSSLEVLDALKSLRVIVQRKV